MGKASRTKVESTRREKIAAQRAAERRAEQRRRILLASGSVVVVLAIVLTFVIVKLNSKPSAVDVASARQPQGLSNGPTGSALTAVVNKVTSVPASTLNTVGDGSGSVTGKPTTISGTTLTENGKPEMLYMGAECPPVLRGRALGDDRGAEPVRHVHGTGHGPLRRLERGRRGRAGSGHADLDVPPRHVLQPVPETSSRRSRRPPTSRTRPPGGTPPWRRPPRRSRRWSPSTSGRTATYPSSTSATST